ncbi:MAG: hypothetical protein Q8R36_05145 [bacterium]|nr:hypothetical protein [bacterium]
MEKLKALMKKSPRWVFAILYWVIILLAPTLFPSLIFGFYGFCIGIIVGIILTGMSIHYFFDKLGLNKAALVVNPWWRNRKGVAVRTVLSGWNIFFPWEQIEEDNIFSLDDIPIPFSEEFPAQNGPKVKVVGEIVIAPDPKNLIQYRASRNVVNSRVSNTVLGHISNIISKKDAVTARNEVTEIKTSVTNYFSKGTVSTPEEIEGSKKVTELEGQNGIIFKYADLSNITYGDSFQRARETEATMATLKDGVDKMRGDDKEMPADEAWNNAMIVHTEGQVNSDIKKIAGEGLGAALAFLTGIFDKKNENPDKDKKKRNKKNNPDRDRKGAVQ